MIDKKLIEKKLRGIENYLTEIRSFPKINNFFKFSDNLQFKRFFERNIHLSIELMIDICKHIVSRLSLKEPESYADCFRQLILSRVINEQYEEIYSQMIKYRNLIVHTYEKVDDEITYGIYKKHLTDFDKFVESIREFISSLDD